MSRNIDALLSCSHTLILPSDWPSQRDQPSPIRQLFASGHHSPALSFDFIRSNSLSSPPIPLPAGRRLADLLLFLSPPLSLTSPHLTSLAPTPIMFRPASRALLRAPTTTPVVAVRGPASRRLVSTASSESSKSRGWKNTALRVGLAVGAVYYYNASNVFADLPSSMFLPLIFFFFPPSLLPKSCSVH